MKSCVAACLGALSLAGACAVGEPAVASPPGEWIERLAADEFGDRERAAEKLGDWAKDHAGEARERFFLESVNNPEPEVRKRCRTLLREMVLEEFRRDGQGYVGIQMGQIDVPIQGENAFGVQVSSVVKDTPAEKAGMKAGDVIVELDGKRWTQPGATTAFQKEVMSRKPGDEVPMRIRRRGEEGLVELKVKLARRPPIPTQMLLWQQQLGGIPRGFAGGVPDARELQRREEDEYFNKWYAERRERSRDRKP